MKSYLTNQAVDRRYTPPPHLNPAHRERRSSFFVYTSKTLPQKRSSWQSIHSTDFLCSQVIEWLMDASLAILLFIKTSILLNRAQHSYVCNNRSPEGPKLIEKLGPRYRRKNGPFNPIKLSLVADSPTLCRDLQYYYEEKSPSSSVK